MTVEEEYMTTTEVAQRMGVTLVTAWNRIKRHRLTCYRMPEYPKQVFIKRSDYATLAAPVAIAPGEPVRRQRSA